MADSAREKILKSAKTFFERWAGADAELRELTVSHKTLRILLRRHGMDSNLLVACIDPIRIVGPVRWVEARMEALEIDVPGLRTKGFRVLDLGAGVDVVCAALEIKENVKLN